MIAARTNPFATERAESLLPYDPAWIGDSWEQILARLEALSWRAAVVGPHGSGKTTFLDALAGRLSARGIPVASHFLNRQSVRGTIPPRSASLHPAGLIVCDGVEQLSWRAWRRLLRQSARARGLIVTAHRPTRLPTLLETRVTPEILRRCITRLDPRFPLDPREADRLFHRHSGNLRHALLECYDRAASLDKTSTSIPPHAISPPDANLSPGVA